MITGYNGGGLILEQHVDDPRLCLSAPEAFTVPEYVDSRPYCLPASNQGDSPHCAGYATAGYIEVVNWKNTSVAHQVDGDKIYVKAKTIDGMNGDGTSLTAAITGAELLGYIGKINRISTVGSRRAVQYALHKYGVCIAGFMIDSGWNSASSRTGYIGNQSESLGGHAVLLCWYDSEGVGFQNSWKDWGVKGFGRMTWAQFENQFMYAVVLE